MNGYNFTGNDKVEILIKNETGHTWFGINLTTDLDGNFSYIYNTSSLVPGNYTVYANDLTNPANNKNTGLEVISKPSPPTNGGNGGNGGSTCIPVWDCDDWGDCQLDGYKYRTCTDIKDCHKIDGKPDEQLKCTAAELCNNGLRDSAEQGIDCGGACPPCAEEDEKDQLVDEGVKGGEEGVGVAGGEEEIPVQLPFGLGVRRCPSLPWLFWILYLLVIAFSGYSAYRYRGFRILRKWSDSRKKINNIMRIMFACNILLIILVLLDMYCWFRWYMLLLLAPPIFLIVVIIKELLKKHKQKVRVTKPKKSKKKK
jgi:hypothetical protein